METGRVPSPPRRHAKRGLDALGNTGYSVIWIAQVKLRMGGPHAPARNATIRHSLQHNLLDSARMNASRLGLGEGAVDTLMSYISTTMLPRILEAQRTGIAPSDVTMEVDASTETQEESAIPERPIKRIRCRSEALPVNCEDIDNFAPLTVKQNGSQHATDVLDGDEDADNVDPC